MELFALASLALVAGVVSFTAPCTLPLLPGYVAYISGMSDSEQTVPTSRVLLAAALFVAGFSAVFVALGVTASGLGLLLAQNGRLLAGVLITAASTTTMVEGGMLLAAYSLGLGLPFLGLAVAVARGRVRLGWLRRHSRKLEITGGILLVIMGVAVISGRWTEFMSSMLAVYARLGWPPI